MQTSLPYGFEYLGAGTREVLTPLTDRVFLSFTQAVTAHAGSLIMGPDVSDGKKTSSTK